MEDEGTQDLDSTRDLVLAAMDSATKSTLTSKERATVQTFRCMKEMHERRVEMSKDAPRSCESLCHTVPIIIDLHNTLMKDLIQNPGAFRTSEAFPGGSEESLYLCPTLIESSLESLLDTYNKFVSVPELTLEKTLKVAAWFLNNFLAIHPFSDGNGRLARILTNSILFMHLLQPVPLRPLVDDALSMEARRAVYIQAIEACRSDNSSPIAHRPSDLFAMLVESVWISIRDMLQAAEDDQS